ncbi:MAG: chromosome condensation regulator [Hyperionvirus sp.]|uniref:Chromosome condensation regulator n=1 Tax=Hyperionvirus sp. TaxID=2487770 RepID=A0A3G5A946_9VIRU|nr:MAG: chromosome condensation regulator [Hyperionvirus sp.]
MDLSSLIETLPIDLQHIVISYDRRIIFLLPLRELVKYDWFGLIKIIFGLNYSKKFFTNEAVMKIYINRCRRSITKYGRENTIIKLGDGRLMGCGSNSDGQMGLGNDMGTINVFTVIEDVMKNVVEVGVGSGDATVRLSDGTLMRSSVFTKKKFKKIRLKRKDIVELIYGCGRAKFIRFSDGTIMGYGNAERHCFKRVDYLRDVADVHCGFDHAVLRLMDGTLMSCGVNKYGQLGLGDKVSRGKFTEVCGVDKKNIVEIVADVCISFIRLVDGTIMFCGYNLNGELGFGDKENRDIFTEVKLVPRNIDRVVFGHRHTFLLLSDGGLMGCGDNLLGQLGLGDCSGKNSFTEIGGIPRNIIDVHCGFSNTIIRLGDGTLLGSGQNSDGQLGFGDLNNRRCFQEIPLFSKNIVEVACYKLRTFIRLSDGKLMGSGNNRYGQLGLGKISHKTTFTVIKGIDGFVTEIA